MHRIKKSIHCIGNKLGLHFYNKPQDYEVCYNVQITNLRYSENKVFVILPIPLNTDYQSLKNAPNFTPQIKGKGTDKKYKNEYVFWELNFDSKKTISIKEEFSITVRPRKNDLIKDFSVNDYKHSSEYKLYTKNNSFLNLHNSKIKDLADKIISNDKSINNILKKINNYIISNLRYGNPILGLYSSLDALEKEYVDCGGFSTLFIALCISAGIPARPLSGFWAGYSKNTMHAWLEVLLPNGKWMPIDSSIEQLNKDNKTRKLGCLGSIGSDRIVLSIGCDIPVDINGKTYNIPIFQNPFIVSDNGIDVKVSFITKRI